MNAYQQLKEEAKSVGWPTYYRTDLTKHDRLALRKKDAPTSFVWILRECGTHIVAPFIGIWLIDMVIRLIPGF